MFFEFGLFNNETSFLVERQLDWKQTVTGIIQLT